MNKKYLLGFTVAEVMIAMAIVGVIAAITVPTIMANYQRQTLTTQFQKNYVDLEQNLTFLQAENYAKTNMYSSILNKKDGKDIADTSGKFLKEYYQVQKDCETTAQPCFASAYWNISSGTSANFTCNDGYTITTKSGTAICMIPASIATDEETETETKNPAKVFIDVNGAEDPNIAGRDLFTFNIYEDYSINEIDPALSDEEKQNAKTQLMAGCTTSNNGEGCFTRLLENDWKMNY